MKHFLFTLLLLASVFATADAQTISITNTSVELIGSNSVTRSFYDLDKCYLTYLRYRDWETDRKSTRLNSSHRL